MNHNRTRRVGRRQDPEARWRVKERFCEHRKRLQDLVAGVRFIWNALIVACGVASLASCATTPLDKELCRIGYGAPLTIDYRSAIRNWFRARLKDPVSAQYEFTQPRKGYAHTPPSEGEKLVVGYKVIVKINGKNSDGNYVGFRPYLFIFRNNAITYVFGPAMAETEYALAGY
jgi:hypothetical protein